MRERCIGNINGSWSLVAAHHKAGRRGSGFLGDGFAISSDLQDVSVGLFGVEGDAGTIFKGEAEGAEGLKTGITDIFVVFFREGPCSDNRVEETDNQRNAESAEAIL